MSRGHDRRGVDNQHGYRTRSSAGRKDRRRWCGGRVGVEHVLTTQYPPNLPGWVTARRSVLCGPSDHHLFSRERWTCHHVVMCTQCGRIMREYLGNGCPDYSADAVAAMLREAGEGGADDGDPAPADNAEHWPRTWIVVPVVDESDPPADLDAAPPATDHGQWQKCELWFPDGCTCGAPMPCKLTDRASPTDAGGLASASTPMTT